MNDLYLMFMNMTRKRLRLILTLFTLMIAFMIFGLLAVFNNALNAGVDLSADDRLVVVNKVNFTKTLPYAYYNRIQTVEGVAATAHLNWFGGYYQEPRNFIPMFAASPEELLDVYTEIVLTEAEREAFLADQQSLIVGETTAKQFGWELGMRVPITSNIFSNKAGGQTWDFTIAGIYTGSAPQSDTVSVYFHYDYFNESITFGRDQLGFVGVRTEDPALNEQVIKAIDDMFANSFAETETVPEEIFNKSFIEQIGNIGLIILWVVGAAFFTSLFIVGNTMVLAVRERTREIGVMKSIGFTSARLFRMVLGESILQALVGGSLGLGVSYFMVQALNVIPGLPIPQLVMTEGVVIQSIILMVVLGLVTGVIPAVNALRLNVITALGRQ